MQDFKMIQRHLVATIIFSVILRASAFSYKDAKDWGEKYPQCKGKHQSPIILKSKGMTAFPSINEGLKFTNFNELPTRMIIKNTGHTVEVKADWSRELPKISGGPLHGNYVFEKMTFHWAQKAWRVGLNKNDPYMIDMEMHVFFYNTDLKSFEKAQSQKEGLAAFRVWLKTGYVDPNENVFEILQKNLHKVQFPNSTAEMPANRLLSGILGDTVPSFDFYEGSLDYPPCWESVTWFQYGPVFPIKKNLVTEFRKIKLAEGDVSNIRHTQALNGRQPKTVFLTDGHH